MNERIIELADKAVEDISSGPWNISDEFCKKFAQLIIRECVEQIIIRERADGEWYQDDIFKHFGVEE